MKLRSVRFALVSSVLLAASVAVSGFAYASPTENIALASQAYKTLAAGDAPTAIKLYDQAIDSRELPVENLANALLNRALAQQNLSNHEAALNDYTAALELDAMAPALRSTALYNRGLSQYKVGNRSLAIEDFTNSLLLNPNMPHAFYSRGYALKDSGQLLFAISDFQRALKKEHPDPASVHYALAEVFMKLRRTEDARRELSEVLRLKPDHANAKAQLDKLGVAALTPDVKPASDPVLVTGLENAIDPPAELLQSSTGATPELMATAEKIQDRLPIEETVAAAEVPAEAPAQTVEAPTAETVVETEADNIQTASLPATEETTAPAAQEEIAEAAPISSGWSVQISSAASEDAAWSTWNKLKSKHKLSKDLSPKVVKADLGSKGTFYRVRFTELESKGDAAKLCGQLKKKRINCFVSKG